MPTLQLPDVNGKLYDYQLSNPIVFERNNNKPFNRIAYSAAHVIIKGEHNNGSNSETKIDWDSTLSFRRYLWELGLGVAEAMDTAQRGMGLSWSIALELIQRSLDAASDYPNAQIACGVGTDHLQIGNAKSIEGVISAYKMQSESVEKFGGKLIIMASRELARLAKKPDDYALVYSSLLSQVKQPVILHWLGDMFDPALAGYWGHSDIEEAMNNCIDVITQNQNKIDGIKISLLDKSMEIKMRRRLPGGVKMYTGDDFNFPELIVGDERGYSHALLGVFSAIAPIASVALEELSLGNSQKCLNLLNSTIALSRHIFQSPTRFYKTGIVFMAFLNGQQSHFQMLGKQQNSRTLSHLIELFKLADVAGLLVDPELAKSRMEGIIKNNGAHS